MRYGKPFVDLIASYVEENNIERPDDFVMKSVVNKGRQSIHYTTRPIKKIPLETIAKNKDVRLDAYWKKWKPLQPAAPLNLDYTIDEMVDEYDQDDIYSIISKAAKPHHYRWRNRN